MPNCAEAGLRVSADLHPAAYETSYCFAGEEGITEEGWYWWRPDDVQSPVLGPFDTNEEAGADALAVLRGEGNTLPRAANRERRQLPALHVRPHGIGGNVHSNEPARLAELDA